MYIYCIILYNKQQYINDYNDLILKDIKDMLEKKEENVNLMKILKSNINYIKLLNLIKYKNNEELNFEEEIPEIEESINEYKNKMNILKELYNIII